MHSSEQQGAAWDVETKDVVAALAQLGSFVQLGIHRGHLAPAFVTEDTSAPACQWRQKHRARRLGLALPCIGPSSAKTAGTSYELTGLLSYIGINIDSMACHVIKRSFFFRGRLIARNDLIKFLMLFKTKLVIWSSKGEQNNKHKKME